MSCTSWRPAKRLRQLESIAAHGVVLCEDELEAAGGQSAMGCYAAVLTPVPGHHQHLDAVTHAHQQAGRGATTAWQLVYRTEVVYGTANPEWQPIVWDSWARDATLDSSINQLLVSLHVVHAAEAGGSQQELARPLIPPPNGRPQLSLLLPPPAAHQQPYLSAAAEEHESISDAEQRQREHAGELIHAAHAAAGPAVVIEQDLGQQRPAPNNAEQQQLQGQAVRPRHVEQPGKREKLAQGQQQLAHEADEGQEARATVQQAQSAALNGHQPAERHGQQPNGVQGASEQAMAGAVSTSSGPSTSRAEDCGSADTSIASWTPAQHLQQQQGQQQQQQQGQEEQQRAQQQLQQHASTEPNSQGSSFGSGSRIGGALPSSALQGLPAEACPGRPVAVWRIVPEQLQSLGADLRAVHQPLCQNTVLLEFGDGWYAHPAPIVQLGLQSAAASLQASPEKRARAQAEQAQGAAAGAAAAPGATRRFANLVMSKLLGTASGSESTVGVLEGSSPSVAGYLSDSESEAGSVGSSHSRDTAAITATAAAAALAAGAATAAPAGGALAAAGAAAPGPAGGLGAAPGPGQPKLLTTSSIKQCIESVAALQARLCQLQARSQHQSAAVQARLQARQHARQQQQQLADVRECIEQLRRRAGAAQAALEEAGSAAAAVRREATVRAQALVTTLKVLQATARRLGDASQSLQGEDGRGRLVAALRELVARRCLMVAQLGRIFKVGPMTITVAEAPPGGYLEDRLEQQWAGSGSGRPPAMLALPSNGRAAAAAVAAVAAAGGAAAAATESASKFRHEVRLAIAGLEVRASVWRKAFEEDGYDWDWEEDREAGVAMGYVAQLVDRLSHYLDMPLRYPLLLRGSRSLVLDSLPPSGTWTEEDAPRRSLFGGSRGAVEGGNGAASEGRSPTAYPLFCDSNRERPRFAVGVFLLNKDIIQLLQAHGISAAGPNQLLHNLYKLLLAAESALPRGLLR